ncbi:MAG: DMT family transporter [Alphaproteobacteria bacterium]
MNKFAILFLFLGMAFFGSATPVSKLVGQEFAVMAAAGARVLLAGIVLLPFMIWRDKEFYKIAKRDWLLIAGVAVIGNIGFSAFMLYGMKMVSGVMGSIIMSLTPAVTAMGAVVFMKENITWRKILALLIGICGVVIMHVFSGGESASDAGNAMLLGSALVFAAICCEACYTLMGKAATKDVSPLNLTCLSALVSGVLLLPWMLYEFSDFDFAAVGWSDYIALGWWGVGTMALGSLLWYSGVEKVPGHIAAAFMVVMPISALLLSYILLGEEFRWIHLLGFGLAFLSVLFMTYEHYKNSKKNS